MSLEQRQDRIRISVDPDLQSLIPAFLKHRHDEIKLLQDAFDQADYGQLKKLCHSIKGVGGGYGFPGLSKIAARIETALAHVNTLDIQYGIREFVNYLSCVDVVYETLSEAPLIICIDDEPGMLRLLDRTLTRNGFRVMSSPGGDNAIKLIQAHRPALILMDIKMPGASGHELCARLQENSEDAKIPIIFVTGGGDDNDRARALASNACDVLFKPFDLDVLIQKTRNTLLTATPDSL